MKLIALVIEKYSDLFENQVLNFSDEYKVNFDFKTKELEIKKNQSYIDDFYDKGIYNITPIVGINGTGKSTILRMIANKINSTKFQKYLIVYKDEDHSFSIDKTNLDFLSKNRHINELDVNNRFNLLNMILEGANTDNGNFNVSSVFNVFNKYDNARNFITSPLKISFDFGFNYQDPKTQLCFRKHFSINFVKHYLSTYSLYNQESNVINNFAERLRFILFDQWIISTIDSHIQFSDQFWQDVINESKYESSSKDYIEKMRNKLIAECKLIVENTEKNYSNWLVEELKSIPEKFQDQVKFLQVQAELIDILERHKNLLSFKYGDIIINLSADIQKSESFIREFSEWEENIKYYSNLYKKDLFLKGYRLAMSTGEKNFLILFANTQDVIEQKSEDDKNVFLIDEIELGMHLEWSRQLIGEYINFVKEYSSQDKTIQLIFTTHSPYMLSDIKPGNVIMLEKDDSGQSKVKVLENTFAKNIQEIMKDNLIEKVYGDFALDKINSLIEELHNDELIQDTDGIIKKQIQLISEPILRNKLLEMYNEKFEKDSLLNQKLNQLNLTTEQLEQVRKMIEENKSEKNEKE